jgi:predicted  nucleic acid-binding Zn-ribbon protein
MFKCAECGHKFRSVEAAEWAAFRNGCPTCKGSDIIEDWPEEDEKV